MVHIGYDYEKNKNMKKLLIVFAFVSCSVCNAQNILNVKVYISNPYVESVDVIKTQMYNMDYVRSHYATKVFSMEKNYVNSLYDSLMSFPLTEVARDSIDIVVSSYWGISTILEMDFEPCIVIDFIYDNKFNTNDLCWFFSVNKLGYVCKSSGPEYVLYYPNERFLDFLERQFPGMIFWHEYYIMNRNKEK